MKWIFDLTDRASAGVEAAFAANGGAEDSTDYLRKRAEEIGLDYANQFKVGEDLDLKATFDAVYEKVKQDPSVKDVIASDLAKIAAAAGVDVVAVPADPIGPVAEPVKP